MNRAKGGSIGSNAWRKWGKRRLAKPRERKRKVAKMSERAQSSGRDYPKYFGPTYIVVHKLVWKVFTRFVIKERGEQGEGHVDIRCNGVVLLLDTRRS